MHVWKRIHPELFRRGPNEFIGSLSALALHRQTQPDQPTDRWQPPRSRPGDFFRFLRKAMETHLGIDAEDVMKVLTKQGITRTLAKKTLKIAQDKGRFSIFSLLELAS